MAIILGFVPMAAGKQEHRTARVAEWLPLAIILLLSFAIRLPFRDAVLIRDEGELALLGQRILQGALPYADVYNQKTPFSFYFLAAVQAVAGEGLAALRTATVVYGLATTAVVYAIARRIGGIAAAAFSALAFSAMTFNQSGTVHQASTEIFLLLWVAAAVALWTPGAGRSPARLLLAGAAAGMAYQSKQSGLAVLAFLAAERGWRWLRNERATPGAGRAALADVGLAAAGFTLVFAVVTGAFAAAGGLDAYLACTWTNNWAYVGNRWSEPGRLAHLARAAFGDIAGADLGLWILGATGLVGLGRGASRRPGSGLWLLLLGLGATAFGAGVGFRHYYVPLIVPLAIGCGAACAWLARTSRRRGSVALRTLAGVALIAPWVAPAVHHVQTLTEPDAVPVFSPFDAAQSIAAYVSQRTDPEDCLLIVGSESEIYFHAQRRPCSRHVFTYPLTGRYPYAARLRAEFVDDLEAGRPPLVLVFRSADSLGGPDGERLLADVRAVLRRDYTLETTLPGAGFARPDGADYVFVFRRREADRGES